MLSSHCGNRQGQMSAQIQCLGVLVFAALRHCVTPAGEAYKQDAVHRNKGQDICQERNHAISAHLPRR